MIENKRDLIEYLNEDRIAMHKEKLGGVTGLYVKLLRNTEYHLNTNHRIRAKIYSSCLKIISVVSSISIPPNTFGKGLALYHYGTIIVNPTARFGDYCCIQAGVNVGDNVRGGHTYIWLPDVRLIRM